jgi:glycosyltransferase involved in cell wall biosynthesis
MSLPQKPLRLRIEGWRGINHSYALVNQHQILELTKLDSVQLSHRDLPFAFPHWNRDANTAGFSSADQDLIDHLPDDISDEADCIYRICSPFREEPLPGRRRLMTFMVTETGLSKCNFVNPSSPYEALTRDENIIVTPSRWSKQRIAEYGFPAEKIYIVPHGVDIEAFYPLAASQRSERRQHFEFRDEEVVFLNIGVALWNKGVDILLRAFANLRRQGYPVRLILKDQRDVYGISVQETIRSVGREYPDLLRAENLAVISLVRGNLGQSQLRSLYGLADCYVSPYRAEGFNMPVLEAIACHTPVIVTRGGATDDYCDDQVAYRISGKPGVVSDADHLARYIEPDLDELTDAMASVARGVLPGQTRSAASRRQIIGQFQWRRAALALAELALQPNETSVRLAS